MSLNKFALAICSVILVFLAGVVALVLICQQKSDEENRLTAWNIYNGELVAYNVVIDESKRNGNWRRMVHLEPVNGYKEPIPRPFAITGHDNDGDGQFERIFIREDSGDGYNSIVFAAEGKRIWEPCPADKHRVRPFTDEQVTSAKAQLYLAMTKVHNQEHITRTLEPSRDKPKKG